jgi:hypothetical protein
MNRAQLDARNTAAIQRHWRALVDNGARPPAELLDELAADPAAGRPQDLVDLSTVTGYRIGGQVHDPADVELVFLGTTPATARAESGSSHAPAPRRPRAAVSRARKIKETDGDR